MSAAPADVFTAAELARAAGVSRAAVDALITGGDLRPIPGTALIAPGDAVRAGLRLRRDAALAADAGLLSGREALFASRSRRGLFDSPRGAALSGTVHAIVLLTIVFWRPAATTTAATPPPEDTPRMVFMMVPGPGGGGGGGGARTPRPAARLERKGPDRNRVPVPVTRPERVLATARPVPEPPRPTPAPATPKPVEQPVEPLPSRAITAPVVPAAPSGTEQKGVVENPRPTDAQGTGTGGGAGSGQGTGSGEGRGNGLGEGSGGGTGGGPFRPGSGIEPPRLLREVKADYTDEARRRALTGDVVLEIVVRRDGSVGDVTLLRGLGAGLDQRAVAAVRQWRFSPARRRGEPVDVIVEVAVEFTLR